MAYQWFWTILFQLIDQACAHAQLRIEKKNERNPILRLNGYLVE